MITTIKPKRGIRIEKPMGAPAREQGCTVSSVGLFFKSILFMTYVFAVICLLLTMRIS